MPFEVTMLCILLTSGMQTPLPFDAYYCDTGLPMVVYEEYYDEENINNCCSHELEPGVFGADNAQEGAWLIVWKSPYTGSHELPSAYGDTLWFDVTGRVVDKRSVSGIYLWKYNDKHGRKVHVK